jgi:hypothetical protein
MSATVRVQVVTGVRVTVQLVTGVRVAVKVQGG